MGQEKDTEQPKANSICNNYRILKVVDQIKFSVHPMPQVQCDIVSSTVHTYTYRELIQQPIACVYVYITISHHSTQCIQHIQCHYMYVECSYVHNQTGFALH